MPGSAAPLYIATRESRLALWQAEHVRELLRKRLGLAAELLPMTTRGDQVFERSLSKAGGKGLFVKELENALAARRAQLAVHSLKDVPMDVPSAFAIVAVLEREDARDAFVSPLHASIDELPQGARIGTSSLRRVMQLKALRPDLCIEPLRGNLDTRLRKLDEGDYAAIVLAAAGLKRLGLAHRIRSLFTTRQMLPCAGQGALAIEVRADAGALIGTLGALNHRASWLATAAERAVSRALGGSCTMPLAAHAVWSGEKLCLDAALGHPVALERPLLRAKVEADVRDLAFAEQLGQQAAQALRERGAAQYLQAAQA